MSVKVTLEFLSIAAAVAALSKIEGMATAVSLGGANAPAPAVDNGQPLAATLRQPAPTGAPAPLAPANPASTGGITEAQLVQAAQAYSKANSPKATKAVMSAHGLTKITDAKPEQYATLLAAFQA